MNETMEMPDWLTQRVALTPNAPALIFDNLEGSDNSIKEWTFAELQRDVLKMAATLQKSVEASPNKHVALLLNNSPLFVLAVQALMQLNAVIVPLNIRLTTPELCWQLRDVQADVLLSEKNFAARLQDIQAENNALKIITLDELPESENIFEPRQTLNLANLHTIIYSSGTTGKPKGVMLTYSNHWWSAISSALNLGLSDKDKWLTVLPLFHVGGMSTIFKSSIYGIPIVLHPKFNEASANRAIDKQGVTIASVVSTMLQRMLDERADRPYPAALRCLLLGGGPAPKPLLQRCATINAPVVQSYGLSETASQTATLAPSEALPKLGSAGKPLFPMQLKIEQPDNEGIGEILVRGPMVTKGYWNLPEANAKALGDGWLHTGDLGRLDSDGFLYVVDRRNDLIISGGENIYPAEVEATLLAHPAVEEAGVFGLPDARWGQSVAAAVKVRDGYELDLEALREFCLNRLARYKAPTQFFVLSANEVMPRNAAGKLLRRVLADTYGLKSTQN